MFGFKIVKEKTLQHLTGLLRKEAEENKENLKKIFLQDSDIKNLRGQLNKEIKMRQEATDYLESVEKELNSIKEYGEKVKKVLEENQAAAKSLTFSGLKDYRLVVAENRKCDKCQFDGLNCKKLILADNKTICIAHKKEWSSFLTKNKKQ